ncbi:MAG: hypothetical protein Q9181_006578 [Wetmoreana brouardii]
MVATREVDVCVVSKATMQPIPEYYKPGLTVDDLRHSTEWYIEAKPGTDFQVQVFIKPGFEFWSAWGIEVGIKIDGGVVEYGLRFSKQSVEAMQLSKKPIVFDSVLHSETRQHLSIGFQFGSLSIDEDIDVTQTVLDSQAANLGVIQVSINKVDRVPLHVPQPHQTYYKPLATLDVAEALVEEKHVDSVMVPGETMAEQAPPRRRSSYPLYKPWKCVPKTFTFRYRSEKSLRLLGCLPPCPEQARPGRIKLERGRNSATGARRRGGSGAATGIVKTEANDTVNSSDETTPSEEDLERENNGASGRVARSKRQPQPPNERLVAVVQDFLQAITNTTRSTSAARSVSATAFPPTRSTGVKRERIEDEDDLGNERRRNRFESRAPKRTKTGRRVVIEID